MPLLSQVDRIAATRSTYVYAFRRLAKLHDLPTGRAQDFLQLSSTVQANPAFRADLFRVAESALSNSPELSVQNLVVIVALAFGGNEIAAHTELDVPEPLLQLFTDALAPADDSAQQPAKVSPPVPPQTAAPVDMPVVNSPASRRPVPLQPRPPAPKRPPILQQALLADMPEHAPPAPATEVAKDIQRLESERIALERRIRKMERRLHLVARQVESMQPAAATAVPSHPPVAPPAATPPPTQDRHPFTALIARQKAEATAQSAQDPFLRHPAAAQDERAPVVAPMAEWLQLLRPSARSLLRSRRGLIWLCAVPILAVVVVLLTYSIRQRPTAAHPEADRAQPVSSAAAIPRAQAEAQITNMLASWAEAFANNDPERESSFYAPTVGPYFLQRNVSHQFVEHDKQAYRARGNRIQRFTVSDLDFRFQSPTSAVVNFTKSWSVLGPQQTGWPHSARSRVWVSRLPEGWRITGEQDFRTGG